MNEPLVSIIIPTYNRAHLIGETLDSILAQTYENWECIIVDDGSADETDQVVSRYTEKDKRFKYYQRRENRPKGANACRNYGFEKSKGEFINWFDSDDLMTVDFIKIKLNAIQNTCYDFVITKTKYFNTSLKDEFYTFKSVDISNHNYITQKVNWLTYDAFIKSKFCKKISFNEKLQSGQEFNYFSKLTLLTNRAILIDEYVTLRRYHEDSIRGPLRKDSDKLLRSRYYAHWETYLDLKKQLEPETKVYLIQKCLSLFFYFENYYLSFNPSFLKAILIQLGSKKSFWFLMAIGANALTKKGYYFEKRVRHV